MCPDIDHNIGYEYYAEKYNGFVHTHLEGFGCKGSGGNILIKTILNDNIEPTLKSRFLKID